MLLSILLYRLLYSLFSTVEKQHPAYADRGAQIRVGSICPRLRTGEIHHAERILYWWGYSFSDKGHLLTVAGTRGGKGTNLIIPNLLGITDYSGSWVVIDPKGENAAITAKYQKSVGRKVVVLNPWDLLNEHLDEPQSYNPLDLLADKESMHLVDDVQIIAEMLVPIEKGDKNRFLRIMPVRL